jgi:hypothetical protein
MGFGRIIYGCPSFWTYFENLKALNKIIYPIIQLDKFTNLIGRHAFYTLSIPNCINEVKIQIVHDRNFQLSSLELKAAIHSVLKSLVPIQPDSGNLTLDLGFTFIEPDIITACDFAKLFSDMKIKALVVKLSICDSWELKQSPYLPPSQEFANHISSLCLKFPNQDNLDSFIRRSCNMSFPNLISLQFDEKYPQFDILAEFLVVSPAIKTVKLPYQSKNPGLTEIVSLLSEAKERSINILWPLFSGFFYSICESVGLNWCAPGIKTRFHNTRVGLIEEISNAELFSFTVMKPTTPQTQIRITNCYNIDVINNTMRYQKTIN